MKNESWIYKEEAILEQKLDDAKKEGREKGRKVEKIEVAKNLLKAGVSVDLTAESTGLPQAEITQLKKKETF